MKKKYFTILILFLLLFSSKIIKGYEISDGVYIIQSAYNSSKVIDLSGGNVVNTSNIQIYDSNNTFAQKWYIKSVENGYYTISTFSNENMVMDVAGGQKLNAANVQLYMYNGTDAQLWSIEDLGNGYVSFVSKCNNLVLDVAGGKFVNGSNIQVYEKNNTNAQKFKIISEKYDVIENGIYTINSAIDESMVLNVNGPGISGLSNVNLYNLGNIDNQQWNFEYLNNGFYKISPIGNNNLALDVDWGWGVRDNNVRLYESNGTAAQQWLIRDIGNGEYSIISKLGFLNLDIAGGRIVNNSNIQTYKGNNTNAQKFKIKKVMQSDDSIIESGEYYIVPSNNKEKALDMSGIELVSGANVQLYDLNYTWAQTWHIERNSEGIYKISPALDTNLSLSVFQESFSSNSNVELYTDSGDIKQQWLIKDDGNGEYNIISRFNNDYLSFDSYLNGSNVITASNNNSEYQKFNLVKASKKPLKDGLYTIESYIDNKALSINYSGLLEGSSIILEENNSNKSKWYVRYLNNGYYSISSAFSDDYRLGVNNSKNNLLLSKINSENNQQWYIYFKDGKYYIKLRGENLAIGSTEDITDEHKNIVTVEEYNQTENEEYIFNDTELENDYYESMVNLQDGYYVIHSSLNNDLVMDKESSSTKDYTNVVMNTYDSLLSQVWYIEKVDGGYYSVSSALNRNSSLDISSPNTNSETNIHLYRTNNSDSQKWTIKSNSDGTVSFVSNYNQLYLDYNLNNNVVINVFDNSSETQKFKLEPYTDTKIYKGIDVSSHNGTINWGEVANEVDFAIIRLGYGGGEDGRDDTNFIDNVRGCEEYNIPYGVYLYSYALNSDIDTTVEIEHARNLLSGINPNLGTKVFFDMEDADNWKRRHGVYDDNVLLNTITDKFCAGVESYGYSCGIYANVDWLTNKLDAVSLANKYTIWVAIWPDNSNINNYSTAYNMRPAYNLTSYNYWQFTSNGYINGINGAVDLNLGYDIFD